MAFYNGNERLKMNRKLPKFPTRDLRNIDRRYNARFSLEKGQLSNLKEKMANFPISTNVIP